jgi:hypothetical protein
MRRLNSQLAHAYLTINHPQGSIYIVEKDTDSTLAWKCGRTQSDELMSYWGLKFEDYATHSREGTMANGLELARVHDLLIVCAACTVDSTESDGRQEPVSTIPCYCSVLRASVGSHLILMTCETDCCMGTPLPIPRSSRDNCSTTISH